jgi:putative endonuclease
LFPCEGGGPDLGWRFSGSPAILTQVKPGYVYIMASGRNGTLYTDVTSELAQRAWQHREGLVPGFTRKYNCKLLVWFEAHEDIQDARLREPQLKKWKRQSKLSEIERMNPHWEDLSSTLPQGSFRSLTGPLPSQGNKRDIHSSVARNANAAGYPCCRAD